MFSDKDRKVARDLSLLKANLRRSYLPPRFEAGKFQRNQCLTITVTASVAPVGLASWRKHRDYTNNGSRGVSSPGGVPHAWSRGEFCPLITRYRSFNVAVNGLAVCWDGNAPEIEH